MTGFYRDFYWVVTGSTGFDWVVSVIIFFSKRRIGIWQQLSSTRWKKNKMHKESEEEPPSWKVWTSEARDRSEPPDAGARCCVRLPNGLQPYVALSLSLSLYLSLYLSFVVAAASAAVAVSVEVTAGGEGVEELRKKKLPVHIFFRRNNLISRRSRAINMVPWTESELDDLYLSMALN